MITKPNVIVFFTDQQRWEEPGSDKYKDAFLYDLKADPHEMVNLVDSKAHRPVIDRMRQRLIDRMKQAGETVPVILSSEMKDSGQRTIKLFEIKQ